jgi:hypothetical protein
MGELVTTELAVGDEVRIHFHPPGLMKSFCEGVVSRVDVKSPEGRFFVVEVNHEVILDREHRIRPGFKDYVLYECRNDFPGRIEVLSAAAQEVGGEPAPDAIMTELPEESKQEADEPHRVELEIYSDPDTVEVREAATSFEQTQVYVERQPAHKPRGLLATLFGRSK